MTWWSPRRSKPATVTFSATIASMNDHDCSVRSMARHLRERQSSWSGHVEAWLDAPFPVLPVRYEDDLLADTLGELTRMVRFLGLDCAAERLRQAVRTTGFRHLRAREEREGFRENKRGPHCSSTPARPASGGGT